jgi:hypothetical protein
MPNARVFVCDYDENEVRNTGHEDVQANSLFMNLDHHVSQHGPETKDQGHDNALLDARKALLAVDADLDLSPVTLSFHGCGGTRERAARCPRMSCGPKMMGGM